MIRRLAVIAAAVLWGLMVFLCTGTLSFPGDALAERAVYEAERQSRGAYRLELGELKPWWLGLKTSSFKLYGRPDAEGSAPLLLLATDARAAIRPTSLLSRAPWVSGSVTLGSDGYLGYTLGTSRTESGDWVVSHVEVDSDLFPLSEVLALIPAYQGDGSGKLAVHMAIDAPEGARSADGQVELRGTGLRLLDPVIADFPLGRDVQIDELDIELDIEKGKAKIKRGRIVSDLATATLSGTISLVEPLERSSVDIRVEAELDPSMSAMASMLKSAEVNGKLVWRCVGRLGALQRACRPGEGRKARGRRGRGRGKGARGSSSGARRPPRGKGLSAEDREKRRKELQERLRRRRERRRAERAKRPPEPPPEDPLDEELPPEDEEPLPEDDPEGFDEEPLPEDEEFVEE